MNNPKITADYLLGLVREAAEKFPDMRTGKNVQYTVAEAAMSACAVFYMQSPSFLSAQKLLQKKQGKNNARSLFGIKEFLSDNQIRNLLDPVSPDHLKGVFTELIEVAKEMGLLDKLRTESGEILVAIDGTWYQSSTQIHCDKCLYKKDAKGKKLYYHNMVTPVIVSPGKTHVLPLVPEYIEPQDGKEKQDCENTAAKRWLRSSCLKKQLGEVVILGDDLYCHHDMIQKIQETGYSYVLVCKPGSHVSMYDWISKCEENVDIQTVSERVWNGKYKEERVYRWVLSAPIRDTQDAIKVNWCEVTITNTRTGKQTYRNSFVTDKQVTSETVASIVEKGRTRWKVENESNNTLKTKGYNLEHNYGHGTLYLSSLLASFTLIALCIHTLLDMGYELYQQVREELPSRTIFFQHLRTVTTYVCFSSWDRLLLFMRGGLTDKYG
jgi:hypothetical protein